MSGAASAVTSNSCGTDSSGNDSSLLDADANGIAQTTGACHNSGDSNGLSKPAVKINGNGNRDGHEDINNVLVNGATNAHSSPSDIEQHRYRPQKYCSVCGDKAIACNFNAVTCESCKAFFRRNAFKESRLKCLFENRCLIDRVTRRFCSKCRLLKCFQIGMKREWILTDEQKQLKRVKIAQNKQSRTRQQREDVPVASGPVSVANDSDEDIMTDESYNNNNNSNSNNNNGSTTGVDADEVEFQRDAGAKRKAQQIGNIQDPESEPSDINGQKKAKAVKTKDASTSCPDDRDRSLGGSLVNYCSFSSQCQYCSVQLNNLNNNVQPNTQPLIGSLASPTGVSLNGQPHQHHQQPHHQQQYHLQQHQQRPPAPPHQQPQHMLHGPNGFSGASSGQANPLAMSFQQIHPPPPPYGTMAPAANYQAAPYHLQSQEASPAPVAVSEPALRPPPTTCCCMGLDGRHSQYRNFAASIHHPHLDQYNNCADQPLRSNPAGPCGAPSAQHPYAAPNLIQMHAQQVVSSSTSSLQHSTQQLHPMSNARQQSHMGVTHVKLTCANGSPRAAPAAALAKPTQLAKLPVSAAYDSQTGDDEAKVNENATLISDTGGRRVCRAPDTAPVDTNAAPISLAVDSTNSPPEAIKLDIKQIQWRGAVYADPAWTEAEVRARVEKMDFTEHERQVIDEMIEATRFIYETGDGDVRKELVTLDDVVQMCDTALRRLIQTVKQIKAFRMLGMDDQIMLLKTACFKILLLRTTFHYQEEVEGWRDSKTGRVIRIDILKGAKKSSVYQRHLDLIKNIPEPLRRDRLVVGMMTLILLFDASNPIKHTSSVGLDNCLYYILLRKYLLATQPDPLAKYEVLAKALELINACNEEYTVFFSKDFQPEQVTPLLIEIFDISINNSS